MDFLARKPRIVGDSLPVDLDFEVDDLSGDFHFELWTVEKQCIGKLDTVSKTGCYFKVRITEEMGCNITAGEYDVRIYKTENCQCNLCDTFRIKFTYSCFVNLVSSTGAGDKENCNQECDYCE